MTEHYTRISDRAAIQYANALKLPLPEPSDVIDVSPAPEDPDRAELRKLVDSLPLEKIRKALEILRVI